MFNNSMIALMHVPGLVVECQQVRHPFRRGTGGGRLTRGRFLRGHRIIRILRIVASVGVGHWVGGRYLGRSKPAVDHVQVKLEVSACGVNATK